MATTKKEIKYINRDFSDFKTRLIEFAKTYFPNTYNDFSEASPGMMFIEQSAYVGDVLSFYIDNQFQENFIQYAQQSNNLYELAYMFGYKPKISTASQVVIDFYQQLPSKLSGLNYVPDFSYALTIPEAAIVTSDNGNSFIIQDKLDFAVSSSLDPTIISVYQVAGNAVQYFLIKKRRKAISSTITSQTFVFENPSPFQTIELDSSNFIKILDVIDSDGNKWYEVDHLGQEMVFDPIKNTNINDPNKIDDTPFLLKLKKVSTRFTTRILNQNTIQLQFGAGSPNDTDEETTPNLNNVGLGLLTNQEKLTSAYSPVNFLFTGTYGISPSNTTLTVRYLEGGGIASNVPSNTLINLDTQFIKFNNPALDPTTSDYIFSSLTSNNPIPANGGKSGDTLEDIRQNTLLSISSQKRSVTENDYLIRVLSMPSEYGAISKACIKQPKLTDNQVSTIETLNLYVLSLNNTGHLDYASPTLKNNLRTYISQYRMIGDTIEIRDAYIINIGLEFEIIVLPEYNNNEILLACVSSIQTYFNLDNWQLNQPILIRDIYILLDKIKGVQTVKNIFIINKSGNNLGYSQYAYDINGATKDQIIYPSIDPSIFELRYPDLDIKGKVVPL